MNIKLYLYLKLYLFLSIQDKKKHSFDFSLDWFKIGLTATLQLKSAGRAASALSA